MLHNLASPKSLFILLFLFFSSEACTTDVCNSDEIFDHEAGLCYKFFSTILSFPDSYVSCRQHGYCLVSIHSNAQNQRVQGSALWEFGSSPDFWVGGSLSDVTGQPWQWIDQSPWNYSSQCCIDEPGPLEDCLSFEKETGYWRPSQCNKLKPYVCARSSGSAKTTAKPVTASTRATRTTTTAPVTVSPRPPLNCVFIGDLSSFGSDITSSQYARETNFILAVANKLYDNEQFEFGASMTYFGNKQPLPDSIVMKSMLSKSDFTAAAVVPQGTVPFPTGITDVVDSLNDDFMWDDGTLNTCLVAFTATAATDEFFSASYKFDTVVGATIGGTSISSFTLMPTVVSSGYNQIDIDNVVNAITANLPPITRPPVPIMTSPSLPPPTVSRPQRTATTIGTAVSLPPINCVFIGDLSSFGTDINEAQYMHERNFILAVANKLYDSDQFAFGASMTYFGYKQLNPDPDDMKVMLGREDFAAAMTPNSSPFPMPSDLSEVVDTLNADFAWDDGVVNKCLVAFTATVDDDGEHFMGSDKFDAVVGATIGGTSASVFTLTPTVVSSDYSQADIDNVVNAISAKFL